MRISDWSSDVCSSDLADLLATVARRLEKRGHTAERTSGFLMRLLFTMFAEDSGLIPEKSFINLLKNQRAAPQHLEHQLAALWAAMDAGDFYPALGAIGRASVRARGCRTV